MEKVEELEKEYYTKFTDKFDLDPGEDYSNSSFIKDTPEDVWSWIEEKLAERENKWISVKDELPYNGSWVIAFSPKFGRHITWYANEKWSDRGSRFMDVTHWQPIPELPKEAENENHL